MEDTVFSRPFGCAQGRLEVVPVCDGVRPIHSPRIPLTPIMR